MARDRRDTSEAWRDFPVAWFVLMERARLRGDADGVARALRELRRLGVEITLRESADSVEGRDPRGGAR